MCPNYLVTEFYMETSKEELLALLTKECELYSSIPAIEQQQKRDKKCFMGRNPIAIIQKRFGFQL
ncbi:hypothetical protein B7489_23315 [Vibrio alginolyticus]|nr:hypothetical protein B7489_23315 [Vibrio alginolyticus]